MRFKKCFATAAYIVVFAEYKKILHITEYRSSIENPQSPGPSNVQILKSYGF